MKIRIAWKTGKTIRLWRTVARCIGRSSIGNVCVAGLLTRCGCHRCKAERVPAARVDVTKGYILRMISAEERAAMDDWENLCH